MSVINRPFYGYSSGTYFITMIHPEKRLVTLFVPCALLFVITLFFGLKPKDFRLINQVERCAELVRTDTAIVMAKKTSPARHPRTALFLFDDLRKDRAADRSGNKWDIAIPLFPKLIRHEVLTLGRLQPVLNHSQASDIIVNLFGFIPFGFSFFLLFVRMTNRRMIALALTLCSAFAVSLGIELAQVFIPTRTSQLIDVLLNTTGAGIGAVFSTGKRGKS